MAYGVQVDWKCTNTLCLIESKITIYVDPVQPLWDQVKEKRVCPECGFKTLGPKPILIVDAISSK